MNIIQLKQDLIRDEGLRTTAYRDSLGKWTIGIGHLLLPVGKDYQGLVWTMAEVEQHFLADVQSALSVAQGIAVYSLLSEARQRAIANMCFEMGLKVLTFTTFLSLLQQSRYKEAGEDLKTTIWYHQVPIRAGRIIQMIEAG